MENRAPVQIGPPDSLGSRLYLPGFPSQDKTHKIEPVTDGTRSIGPTYSPDPYLIPRPEVPKGRLIHFTMDSPGSAYFPGTSAVTGVFSRQVWVYVPKQYVKGEEVPFMVSQDAGYRAQLVWLLDNAIHDKKLPVMVVVFAGSGGGAHGIGIAHDQGTERNLEYDTLSPRYGQWVEKELLPRAEAESRSQMPDQAIRFTSDPQGRGTIGCSSGAAAAFTMAWFMPSSFRRVISFSGSYTNLQYPADPRYPHGASSYPERLISESARKPIRVWLEVGTQDLDWSQWGDFLDWQTANRDMASALASKGYAYHFDLAQGAHHCDGRVADETIAAAMLWLWKGYPIR